MNFSEINNTPELGGQIQEFLQTLVSMAGLQMDRLYTSDEFLALIGKDKRWWTKRRKDARFRNICLRGPKSTGYYVLGRDWYEYLREIQKESDDYEKRKAAGVRGASKTRRRKMQVGVERPKDGKATSTDAGHDEPTAG